MRTHVCIVNDETFPSHLQYLFVGTGNREYNNSITLLTDITRVRVGDLVIFYIEAWQQVSGGFYGVFRIAEQQPLVFHTPGAEGVEPNLGKKLIYRTLVEPHEVYSQGVPEFEALDKLPTYATEIQWSLIYRKLKGRRGCTPLLPWEAQRLIDSIRDNNAGEPLATANSGAGFGWDQENRTIKLTESRQSYPGERSIDLNTIAEIDQRQRQSGGCESALQLHFTVNIDFEPELSGIVGPNPTWFGNEVACGVGMQKMDILTICEPAEGERTYRIVELKGNSVQPDITHQLSYYVNWASQNCGKHLERAFNWNVQPVVVGSPATTSESRERVFSEFRDFNNQEMALPIEYFEFTVEGAEAIRFDQMHY